MKQIEIGGTVYYEDSTDSIHKAEVLQLFTDYTYYGKPYPVALVASTYGKTVRHIVVETQYLTHDSTEYDKQNKRNQIENQINQLQKELSEL